LDTWNKAGTLLIAPALLAFEVTASLRRMVYLKTLSPEQGEAAFAAFGRIAVQLTYRSAIFPVAWELAKQFNQPRTYDASYLALAQLNRSDFWTADERLYNTVKSKLSWVHWVGNLDGSR
jgi:predicted nucleic acid-binding protein